MDAFNSIANLTINAVLSYRDVFTAEECRRIIDCPDVTEAQDASLFKTGPNYNVRNIKVKNLVKTENTSWIEETIAKLAIQTNNLSYKFSIGNIEEIQLWECDENAFMDWHIDIGKGRSATRKISIITFLSDKNDYQDGLFSSSLIKPALETLPQEQGTMLLFPSFRPYMFEQLTRGKMYFLMAWMHGDSFC
jgi:PKHD-type hydroxylase